MSATDPVTDAAQARRRILIVEDEPYTSHYLQTLLVHYGFEVITAKTVALALDALDPAPDIVILDLILPDGDGVTVLRHIREKGLACQVMVVSSVTDEAHLNKVQLYRPTALMIKPVDFLALLLRLREAA